MSLSEAEPSKRIDVKGQVCPYPLIETRNALKALKQNETLEVITDNESSVMETIPMLCEKKGYLLEVVQEADFWHVFIKKTED